MKAARSYPHDRLPRVSFRYAHELQSALQTVLHSFLLQSDFVREFRLPDIPQTGSYIPDAKDYASNDDGYDLHRTFPMRI